MSVLIFALAAFVYSLYGLHGELGGNAALWLYSGQKVAEGVPPYVSIFDQNGPLTPMLAGLGVMISKQLGWSDIYTARLLFFVMGCFAVVSIYLLGNSLFRSQRVGVFAALTFLGFFGFAEEIARGPYQKVPLVLFEVLSLLLTSQRRWFWAGLCGSLSSLVWLPTAIFPLVTLFLAAVQPRERRPAAVVRTSAGIGLPLAAVSAYFYYHGAFYALLDGFILFNVLYSDRPDVPFLSRFLQPVEEAFGYPAMFLPMFIGFVMVVSIYFSRRSLHRSFRDVLTKDAFAPILLSCPVLILWTLIDFQNYRDLFVLLPYLAIGFSKLLDLAVHGMGRSEGATLRGGTQKFLTVGLCVSLVALAVTNPTADAKMDDLRAKFDQQRQAATEIENRFGSDVRLVSINALQVLVLQHRTNPTRYGFILRGIDPYIHATTPGGFEGWIRELEAYNPDVVVLGNPRGPHVETELMGWLNSNYHREAIGPFTLYVRNSIYE